ncbi:phosphoribosylformylglycinamidine synthase subunit PurQ [Candidatus Woesearchaeota archaeon]|nr:MAG: phosphoribosylformylglycinamidine synthase subunit PurQ [Candidatus Woesearchaeota archaeon]
MKEVKACVLYGFGINCDYETKFALGKAGANAERVHITDLIEGRRSLDEFHILAIPGGFSFGDDISAGKVLANRIAYKLGEQTRAFVGSGKLLIGICNGFQVLVKMGILPCLSGDFAWQPYTQLVTLTYNDSGRFEDRWVNLLVNQNTPCVFTKSVERLQLPVRHGEGKFLTLDNVVLQRLREQGQIVLQYADKNFRKPTMTYPYNPNGSIDAIAGICDPSGRVFGLMPHPEAYWSPQNHPCWTRQKVEGNLPEEGLGLKIFRNAVEYVRGDLL